MSAARGLRLLAPLSTVAHYLWANHGGACFSRQQAEGVLLPWVMGYEHFKVGRRPRSRARRLLQLLVGRGDVRKYGRRYYVPKEDFLDELTREWGLRA